MRKITGLLKGYGSSRTIRLFLEGRFVCVLEAEVVLKEGLAVGMELTDSQLEILQECNRYQKCLNAALRFLNYRPRSEYEMTLRLSRHGFCESDIKTVLADLKRQGLIDDSGFARFWKENRQEFNPRSRKLTEAELRQKGVPVEIIEQETGAMDDADCAYRAAKKHARSLNTADYRSFHRRLGEYLRRRGFGYDVINTTIMRLWNEKEGGKIVDYPDA